MKTTAKNTSDTTTQLTITLSKKELADAEKIALKKLSRDLKAPGFRKGKVPLSIAKKHVDAKKLTLEAADHAISTAVATAFTEQGIQVLERPQVEVTEFEPAKKLVFTAEATVLPPIKLPDYKKIALKKPAKPSIKKADIDEVIERIQRQMATKTSVKRAAAEGDEVTIDFVGKLDGEAFDGGSATGHTMVLGSQTFIPGFEEALIGHKAGQEFTIDVTFPDDYHAEDLAGKPATFDVTLHEVKSVKLPKADDTFAAKVGEFTSIKDLRDDIKRELTNQAVQTNLDKLRDQAVEKLVAKCKVALPAVLVEDQIKSIEQDLTQNLTYRQMTPEQYFQTSGFQDRDDWAEKEARPAAETRVKTAMVLSELSKKEQITASDDEIAERVAAIQQQYGGAAEVAEQFSKPEARREVENRLITEKTIDRLVELNS
ncbi:trigger factor [Candidatus Saccharibacteria bacterium]|nr:MAG: trigger factor [Candidatus Saccharibacteria bacterium]